MNPERHRGDRTCRADRYYDLVWASSETRPSEDQRIRQILDMIPADASSVLDVGCGDGRVTNRIRASGRVVGLDSSVEGLKQVSVPKIRSRIHRLPLRDRSFDLVLVADVLEHLEHRDFTRALQEIRRVSRKYVLINAPNRERLREGLARCRDCGVRFHINLHVRSLTPAAVERHFMPSFRCRAVRFSEERWAYQNGAITVFRQRVFDDYRHYRLSVCPGCGRMLDERARGRLTNRVLYRLDELNKWLDGARERFGLFRECVEFFVLLQREAGTADRCVR